MTIFFSSGVDGDVREERRRWKVEYKDTQMSDISRENVKIDDKNVNKCLQNGCIFVHTQIANGACLS